MTSPLATVQIYLWATYNLNSKFWQSHISCSHMTELQVFGNTATFTTICSVPWSYDCILGLFCQKLAVSYVQQNWPHSKPWVHNICGIHLTTAAKKSCKIGLVTYDLWLSWLTIVMGSFYYCCMLRTTCNCRFCQVFLFQFLEIKYSSLYSSTATLTTKCKIIWEGELK